MSPAEKLKTQILTPEKLKTQIANAISDTDGRAGITLYALSTILRMAEA